VPRWFSEGLAVYEERRARPGWGMDVSPGFLRAFHQGRLAPASDMNQAFLRPRYPEQTVHAYYQASLVMEMIEQRRGFDAIVAMLRGYAKGRSTAELLTEVAGMSPRALDAAFDDFVRNRFGRSLDGLFARDGGGTPYGALLKQGRDALERGDPAAAREPLRRALELFPDHAGPGSAYRLLAAAEENAGAPRDAIDLLRRAIDIDADDLEGHRQLARLYRQQGEPEQAAAVMQRTLLIQPFDPAIHEDIAEIRESRADWAAAVPARAAVVALEPVDEAGARFRLARALDRSGNTAEARHEVLRALEVAPMYEEALELLLAVREELAEEGDRGETQPGATR
jgi:tetratricopeptide (TPR) repeat protein